MHLSRVLSPVMDVLTPSLFAVRAPLLFEAPAVEGVTEAVDALRCGGTLVAPAAFIKTVRYETEKKKRNFAHLRRLSRCPLRRSRRPASPCLRPFSRCVRSPWRARRRPSTRASAVSRRRDQLCSPATTIRRFKGRERGGTGRKEKSREQAVFDAP